MTEMEQEKEAGCPHCNKPSKKWRCPPGSSWEVEFLYVCFNDECPYFVRGWEWMRKQFNQNISYRYSLDPVKGGISPLPVWSKDALKDSIIE